jgi:hypothetical protein
MKLTRLVSLSVLAVLLVSACKSSDDKLAEAAARGNTVYKQYKTSDYPTAKAALLDHINFLDRTAASDPELANTFNADAMLSYVRLAKLEQKNRGSDEARYLGEAISRCGKRAVKGNCSADALTAEVDKVDALPPK